MIYLAVLIQAKNVQAQEYPFLDMNGEDFNENIGFVGNAGQLVNTDNDAISEVLFHSVRANPVSFFQENKISFVYSKIAELDVENDTAYRLDLTWVGENRHSSYPISGTIASEKYNFYLNTCPTDCGKLNVYKSLKYESIYDNINLIVSSNKAFYKFYFECLPQSQPNNIELDILGSDSVLLIGDLVVVYQDGIKLILSKPKAYQVSSTGQITVLSWQPKLKKTMSGSILVETNGSYDANSSLVYMFSDNVAQAASYETKNLVKGKLEGGSGWDSYYDIDIYVPDGETENPIVCGQTNSTNFPTTFKYFGSNGGSNEILVVSYNNDLTRKWSIMYGGSNADGYLNRYGISTDNLGNIFIAPESKSNDIPLVDISGTADYFDNVTSGSEIVIARFDKDGGHTYATFFGGNGQADPGDILVNKTTGEFYVCGIENGFPLVDPGNGAFPAGFTNQNSASNFIAKFNSSLTLLWSTGFGGINSLTNNPDYEVNSLDLDQNNNLVIAGKAANGANFPIKNLSGAMNNAYAGGLWDGFIGRFDGNLALEWCTYFGGTGKDHINRLIVTNMDEIAVTGFTQTTSSFPFLAPSGSYSQSNYGGNGANRFGDAFFSVLNPNGSLKYSSYLGGQSGDEGFALASLRRGLGNNIFTGGNTRSSNFPIPSGQSNLLYVNNLLGNANDTYKDGYIASFDKDLSLKWSTYIGGGSHISGNGEDEILSAACHELNVYFIGNTNSSDFKPVRDFSNIFNGGVNDGFILKFQMEGTPLSIKKQLINNEKDFLVYPVPAQDFLILDLDKRFGNEIEFLNLFNFCGKQIENVNFDEQNSKLILENLENGFYLLSIKIKDNNEIIRVKFVINK